MIREAGKKVAFISSFPPRQCGIAGFTSELIKSIELAAGGGFEPVVVAIESGAELKYNGPVRVKVRKNAADDYVFAADHINFSDVDVVSVQHEFGLFGGAAGSYLNLFLERLNKPVMSTLHTVLQKPSREYFNSLVNVCESSERVIVMNKYGGRMLRDIYGVPAAKIELIPHGIPDLPLADSNYYKQKLGIGGRKIILTFGLLSRNKGIEVMLRALPSIVKADPSVLYIVLGATHPEVLRIRGESYRLYLQRMVRELGLQEHVKFYNRFANDDELRDFLRAADVYISPYLRREQSTSGTLAFAVGTGKAVVSTPYWAAAELLAEGRGNLVPFGSSSQIARSIVQILGNHTLFSSIKRRAYEYGRTMTWPKVGRAYWKLLRTKPLAISPPDSGSLSDEKTTVRSCDRYRRQYSYHRRPYESCGQLNRPHT